MKVWILNLLIFFPLTAFGAEDLNLEDLPPPTIENMRWNIPAEDWFYKDEYFIKGKYFKINLALEYVKRNQDGTQVRQFKVYQDSSLRKDPLFGVTTGFVFDKNDKLICELVSKLAEEKSKHFIECRDGGCEKKNSDFPKDVQTFHDLAYEMRKSHTEPCPYQLDYVTVSQFTSETEGSYILFRFNKISDDKKSLEITVNGKPAYLDIRNCGLSTTDPSKFCEVVNFKHSKYESNWLKLKEIQKNKSHVNLNRAIKLITPCLKTKDVKCVEKYITREGEADSMFIATEITPDVFEELEHCLNYKNLLPHLMASRGLRKACIFNENSGDKPLRGVAYIEALSKNGRYLKAK